jgi:hypothetical protein
MTEVAATEVENLPESHVTHVSMAVAVTVPEYVPGRQAVHVDASLAENAPAWQASTWMPMPLRGARLSCW